MKLAVVLTSDQELQLIAAHKATRDGLKLLGEWMPGEYLYEADREDLESAFIDLVGHFLDITLGMDAVVRAAAATDVEELLAQERRRRAAEAAQAMLARDSRGKQAAKREAHSIWRRWSAGELRKEFPTQAALARHIVETTALESTKAVEGLITRWNRGDIQ